LDGGGGEAADDPRPSPHCPRRFSTTARVGQCVVVGTLADIGA
jgi:hypothetical protein